MSNLLLRSLTSLVAMPVVFATIWLGSPIVDLVVWFFLLGALVEWARLCGYRYTHGIIAIVVGIALYTTYGATRLSIPLVGASFLAVGWLSYHFFRRLPLREPLVYIAGVFYISFSLIQLIFFFYKDFNTPYLLLWLLLLVWANDIGAYIMGSWFGGPLLAPQISPKKTWAGFIGGIACGWATSTTFIFFTDLASLYSPWIYAWGFFLSIVSHMGDLLESAAKRFFKVKDSGHLIPGHGGILDRLDSIMAASLVLGFFLKSRGYF